MSIYWNTQSPHLNLIKMYLTVLFLESISLMLELLEWFFKFVTFSRHIDYFDFTLLS